MELKEGMLVILSNASDRGGKMACRVAAVRADGGQAVFVPLDSALQAWFVNGYTLGRAHWDELVEVLPAVRRHSRLDVSTGEYVPSREGK
jgi:hypothetical protein